MSILTEYRIFFAAIVLHFLSLPISQAATEDNDPYVDGPAIWEISDTDTTIYLFGTVHILSEETAWRTDDFDMLWHSAGTVYFETDTSSETVAELQGFIMSEALNDPGTKLSSYYNEEDLALLREAVVQVGLPFSNFEPYRPWFVTITLTVLKIVAEGGDPELGVDMILSREARNAGTPIRFLETGEYQVRLLADMPNETAAQMLIEGIRQTREIPGYFSRLVSFWQNGDSEALGELINASMEQDTTGFAEKLLYNRNRQWAQTLAILMEQEVGIFFVAVGAGHLVGENSVQDYMTEYGYTAERY